MLYFIPTLNTQAAGRIFRQRRTNHMNEIFFCSKEKKKTECQTSHTLMGWGFCGGEGGLLSVWKLWLIAGVMLQEKWLPRSFALCLPDWWARCRYRWGWGGERRGKPTNNIRFRWPKDGGGPQWITNDVHHSYALECEWRRKIETLWLCKVHRAGSGATSRKKTSLKCMRVDPCVPLYCSLLRMPLRITCINERWVCVAETFVTVGRINQ